MGMPITCYIVDRIYESMMLRVLCITSKKIVTLYLINERKFKVVNIMKMQIVDDNKKLHENFSQDASKMHTQVHDM